MFKSATVFSLVQKYAHGGATGVGPRFDGAGFELPWSAAGVVSTAFEIASVLLSVTAGPLEAKP